MPACATDAEIVAAIDRGLTQREVAAEYGWTQSKVSRTVRRARREAEHATAVKAESRRHVNRERKRTSRAAATSAHEEAIRIARDVLQLDDEVIAQVVASPSIGRVVMAETKAALEEQCRTTLADPRSTPEDVKRVADHVIDFVERGPWDERHDWWIDRRRVNAAETPVDVLTYYGKSPTRAPYHGVYGDGSVPTPRLRNELLLEVATTPEQR